MKIVFLHGIGDGDPERGWLTGLNRRLAQLGHPPVADNLVIAPRYSDLLKTDGVAAKMPPVTYQAQDEAARRQVFARRQAAVQRRIGVDGSVRTFGFNHVPEPLLHPLTDFAVDNLALLNLRQVRRYVKSDGLRGAVLTRVLEHLPHHGEVLVIGHSLGSVIAIDLLDHLPPDLRVRRFITVGSPAHSPVLHEGSERLLKRFPYGRVDDWSNFLDTRDVVTGGRGLAWVFPAAQDFSVDNGASHAASAYLGHPAVAGLAAHLLYPSHDLVPTYGTVAVRMTDNEASVLLMLHFAEAVRRKVRDKGTAERYREACTLVRDDICGQIRREALATGAPVATEVLELLAGGLPHLPHRWELHESVQELTVLALTNIVEPFDIDTGNAPRDALADVAVEMGFPRTVGVTIGKAIEEVQAAISRRGGPPWGRFVTAAVGLSVLAAGPVGLMAAVPTTLAGAAAITSGLAAFGPGGMLGGLAMLGGLTGTGAALTAAAAARGSGGAVPLNDATQLVLRVATEYARKLLDLPTDDGLWHSLAGAETQFSAQINRLESFSDARSIQLAKIKEARTIVSRLMLFLLAKGMAPTMLTEATADQDQHTELD